MKKIKNTNKIQILKVRSLRKELSELRNDLIDIEKKVEEEVHTYFEGKATSTSPLPHEAMDNANKGTAPKSPKPFLKIKAVQVI